MTTVQRSMTVDQLVSTNINTLMYWRGVSGRQLSASTEIPAGVIQRRLKRRYGWTLEEIDALAHAFLVTMDELTYTLPDEAEMRRRWEIDGIRWAPRGSNPEPADLKKRSREAFALGA